MNVDLAVFGVGLAIFGACIVYVLRVGKTAGRNEVDKELVIATLEAERNNHQFVERDFEAAKKENEKFRQKLAELQPDGNWNVVLPDAPLHDSNTDPAGLARTTPRKNG